MALKAHEIATVALKKEPKEDQLKTALDSLDSAKDALQKVIAEASKVNKDAEMEFIVQALQKIDFVKEIRSLESEVKDEPWKWGFLVRHKPIEHRFLLHRSKNGRELALAAAKELGRPPKLSFGTAIRCAYDNATIALTVQGVMLAGLATRLKKILAKMKRRQSAKWC